MGALDMPVETMQWMNNPRTSHPFLSVLETIQVPPNHAPQLLFPCGHTFCFTCINAHVDKHHKGHCPVCRKKIESRVRGAGPGARAQYLVSGCGVQMCCEKIERRVRVGGVWDAQSVVRVWDSDAPRED